MSTILEITTLDRVILYKFQKMIADGTSKPVLLFGKLWHICSNAACRMKDQGVHNPVTEKKLFARQFFESIDLLCSSGTCLKREEENGPRTQLISLALTDAGRVRVATIIFAAQERAQEAEVIWNPRASKKYRGPIL